MKQLFLIMTMFIALTFSACSENKAKELYETAQFEELQNNREHAGQLYEEIISKYHDTEYAKMAKERLSKLKQDEASEKEAQ